MNHGGYRQVFLAGATPRWGLPFSIQAIEAIATTHILSQLLAIVLPLNHLSQHNPCIVTRQGQPLFLGHFLAVVLGELSRYLSFIVGFHAVELFHLQPWRTALSQPPWLTLTNRLLRPRSDTPLIGNSHRVPVWILVVLLCRSGIGFHIGQNPLLSPAVVGLFLSLPLLVKKLLTTGNPDVERDRSLLARLGMSPL